MSELVRIRCKVAPLINRKEGVALWHVGDEDEIAMSGYWQGQIDRGVIEIVDGEASTQTAESDAPEVGVQYLFGKNNIPVVVVDITDKGVLVQKIEDGRKFPVKLDNWNAVRIEVQ